MKSESRKALAKLVGLKGKVKITYTGDDPKKASSFEFTLELVSAAEDKFTNQMLSELAEILTK